MLKRVSVTAAVLFALILPGCKVWKFTRDIPSKTAHGAADALTRVYRASERSYDWRRTKVSPDAQYDAGGAEELDGWIVENLEDGEYCGRMPYEIRCRIPRKYLKSVDLLQEFAPTSFGRRVAVKNSDETWNGEVLYDLNADGAIVLETEGPKTMFILSMLAVSRERALENVRKYIYTITDESGEVKSVSAPTTRARGMWFYHTEAQSGSVPHIYVLEVPEGSHVYALGFRFNSGEGDIMFKFLEPWED